MSCVSRLLNQLHFEFRVSSLDGSTIVEQLHSGKVILKLSINLAL